MLKAFADSLLNILYPQICRVCGGGVESYHDGIACAGCWSDTHLFKGDETLCTKCGAFLGDGLRRSEKQCGDCTDHFYTLARAAGAYGRALAAAVIELKVRPAVSRRVRTELIDAFERTAFPTIDMILPSPLAKARLLERGFNQAELLADVIAGHVGIKTDKDVLFRRTHTPKHRAGMDAKAREATVINAFGVSDDAAVRGKNILLIDDVLTTGATASHCAKALKNRGAGEVYLLTLARAL